ncbi:MAG: SsrA-binding protein SmpB [Candidatus Harrisonbacteria bacterium]|nr:SsrA-binding protein SmpB [Candidatus Harrisonbacteria bacterium]
MKYLSENRKAQFDYEILETYEAGLVLTGQEVKSIKAGHANLTGSYVIIKPNGAFLINAQIPPYQPKNSPPDYEPSRTRQLLLRKEELKYLLGKAKEGNLTMVPLSLYNKGRRLKISIGLARYKKKQDKRETIKKREFEREARRTLKE